MSTKNTKGWLAIDVCAHCKKPASTKCADCRISSYCSQRCQKFNRKQHRYFMQCSKDNKTEMTGENKIMFEEFLEAQALLSYAFFGTGIDFGINDLCVREYLQRETKLLIPENCPIDIEITHKVALETKLFATYRGNVYYQNTCFGLLRDALEGHFSTQDPVLISTDEQTARFTPKCLLEKLAGAAVIEDADDLQSFENDTKKPILACAEHKEIEEVSLYQMRNGILISTNCM